MTDKPLYNSRIIDLYLKLVRENYPHVEVRDLLRHAGMKPYEVADQNHWFTQEQIDRFYERLVQLTGNERIAREAGRFFASPKAMNVMQQYVLGMLGLARGFEALEKTASNFSRSSRYTSRRLSANRVEITVTPLPGVTERPFQCENRTGFFEAMAMLFTHRLPRMEHPECMFSGGQACRYLVAWESTPAMHLQRARNLTAALLLPPLLLWLIVAPWSALTAALPVAAVLLGGLTLAGAWFEKREVLGSLRSLWASADLLLEQMQINYNNALLGNEIGQAISSQTTLDNVLHSVTQALGKRLDYDRGMILLANPERSRLQFTAGFGYTPEQQEMLRTVAFSLDRPQSRGVFVVSFKEQRPFLINDLNDIQADLSPRSLAVAKNLGAKSFICCPIICDNQALGVLAVDNMESKKPLVQSDLTLLTGIAPLIGISIRNAELLAARKELFDSMLEVLSASTDARDPMTAGHSEKVTEYALGICDELNLPAEFREMMRVAALLHDYGKIGIPDAILKKDGKLDPDEYEIVKTHARKTREILRRIKFTGVFAQVPEVAGSHHEKIDGSGYPDALSGDQIPFGARIIAVADYFDAITSMRHYRAPMPISEAFALIRAESGRLFEPELGAALIRYYERTYLGPAGSSEVCELGRRQRRTRHPWHAEVTVTGLWQSPCRATGVDLSTLGAYLDTEVPAAVDMVIEVSFALPGQESRPLRAKGRVAWLNTAGERRKARYPVGFGVEFLDLRRPDQERINTYLMERVAHA